MSSPYVRRSADMRPRELTPEEAERDNRLRIMLDDIRRESQRSQQAAQESQELAPAPGLAPEDTGKAEASAIIDQLKAKQRA